jgi:hypothetical protein
MSSFRILIIVIAAVAGLALLRFRPWERAVEPQAPGAAQSGDATSGQRERLTVGFLPVT